MVNIIGVIATIFTTLAFFPQIFKSIKVKHTGDLSWKFLGVLLLGIVLWTIYGFQLSEPPIYVSNIIILFSGLFLGYLKYIYDKRSPNGN